MAGEIEYFKQCNQVKYTFNAIKKKRIVPPEAEHLVPRAAVTMKAFTHFLSQDGHIIHCLFAEEPVTRNGGC